MKFHLAYFLCFLSVIVSAQSLDTFDIQTQLTPTPKGSYPSGFYNHKETLYFYAGVGNHGNQFHKTDGTYHPITYQLYPSYNNISISIVNQPIMTTIGNDLYFVGDDSVHGQEIWRHDGVKPYLLVDLDSSNNRNPGSNPINWLYSSGDYLVYNRLSGNKTNIYNVKTKTNTPLNIPNRNFAPVAVTNNTLLFSALMPNSTFIDFELATYNLLTHSLTYYELTPGGGGTAIPNYVIDNNKVYFVARTQLHVFDTDNNLHPTRLTDSNEFNNGDFIIYDLLGKHNGNIYFTAKSNNNRNPYLYKYNQQNQTTSFVDSTHANIKQIASYANKLFYVAVDSNYGEELFMIDENGNVSLAADLDIGKNSGYPWGLTVANNCLFFSGYTPSVGRELFVYYDATASVKNTRFSADVTLYPNPTYADAIIKVVLRQQASLSVLLTDMLGRVVYKKALEEYNKGEHTITLPIQNEPTGIYIYNIVDRNGSMMASGKLEKL